MPPREYPLGLDGGALWKPWREAKNAVELYPKGRQEPGCEVALIRHDAEARRLELHLRGLKIPAACPRFASRACPRMESMGHEPAQQTCNYWDYPRTESLAPRLELYPEWQRFDCHKFYPLLQALLCGEELALRLAAEVFFIFESRDPEDAARLRPWAALCSRPEAWIWKAL